MDCFSFARHVPVVSDRVVRSLNQLHLSLEVVGDFEGRRLPGLFQIDKNVVLVDGELDWIAPMVEVLCVYRKQNTRVI